RRRSPRRSTADSARHRDRCAVVTDPPSDWTYLKTESRYCRLRRVETRGENGQKRLAESPLRFFFEFFFFRRTESRRGAQRFAIIEQRQVAHVQRERAGRRLLVDDHRHRAAFDSVTK